ncbi:hypothetical protein [Terrisporobacter hibernicus]|uniref:Uncharacterized protein n=1 Tax=Terrisporobacter hibernicus TaxID=2813371 RepID=A0AAX2ZJ03_9FIRM|nr:hypothetical protein [Terrisporobacter hibernicus]UEL48745.1 hypothetical protein JW646_04640 [Terrisporobacter hibernicus]
MKRKYAKPSMSIDMFEANEYIAACYKISCNVPSGVGYNETNGTDGYQSDEYKKVNGKWVLVKGDDYIASGSGCGVWHRVRLNAKPTNNAMWDPDHGKEYPVYHWTQGSGNNGHHFSSRWDSDPNAS